VQTRQLSIVHYGISSFILYWRLKNENYNIMNGKKLAKNMKSEKSSIVVIVVMLFHHQYVHCLTIPVRQTRYSVRTPSFRPRRISTHFPTTRLSSTKVVMEDVDGIGKLTEDAMDTTTNLGTMAENVTDIPLEEMKDIMLVEDASAPKTEESSKSTLTSQSNGDILSAIDDSQLTDPAAVVEQIIGTTSSPPTNPDTTEMHPIAVEPIIEQPPDIPSISKIIKFTIPAIGIWLCGPILSLIDTSSVGLLSGTIQQAALNPAVALTDYTLILVAFMYTASTNLIASARESSANSQNTTAKTLVNSMQLSIYVGLFAGTVLTAFTTNLLQWIIGNESLHVGVFETAKKYVRIRALGMPAAVAIGSAQAACIGMKDVRSPLYVLFTAAVVNLFGDVLMVPLSSPWLGGASGAAWATVFSQYVALFAFIKWFTGKTGKESKLQNADGNDVEKVNISDAILELTGESKEGKSRRRQFREGLRNFRCSSSEKQSQEKQQERKEFFSTKGFLRGKFSFGQLVQGLTLKEAKAFWPYFIPVTTTSIGRVSVYVTMSHIVASALGTNSMAAHQIIVSFFYCLCPIADSLNLTAQSFIPPIYEKKPGQLRNKALKTARDNFYKVGLVFGGVMASAILTIPIIGKMFTADPLVLMEVNSVIPSLLGWFIVHGCVTASEGLLLGQKDLGFLAKQYVLYFFAVPLMLLPVKRAALAGCTAGGLKRMWNITFRYNVVRLISHSMRLFYLQRRGEKVIKE